jgi:glycosyltransferase involved in cell wall biosynthesis
MKVLHVCAVGFTVKNLLVPQINYFLKQGLEVEIVCSPSKEVEELQRQGYLIHPIQIDRKISPISNIKSVINIIKLIANNKYDLVHVHTPIASVLGRIAAKIAGCKVIIYTAHGFYFHENMTPNQYRFYHTVEKVTASITDLILTQSKEDLITAEKTGLCHSNKLRYLGNGVDISRFKKSHFTDELKINLKQELKIPKTAFPLMGMTGRITQEKGYFELIEALKILRQQFPNVNLVVIGGQLTSERDSFQSQLSQFISDHNLDNNVTFTGFRSDIPEILSLLDIFTLPSYREGLPRSILEAMAMELPVVTTDIRGCREAVIHNETGLIVPHKDSKKLAEALEELLNDENKRKVFGKNGRHRVEKEYDENLVFHRLEKYYQELGVA